MPFPIADDGDDGGGGGGGDGGGGNVDGDGGGGNGDEYMAEGAPSELGGRAAAGVMPIKGIGGDGGSSGGSDDISIDKRNIGTTKYNDNVSGRGIKSGGGSTMASGAAQLPDPRTMTPPQKRRFGGRLAAITSPSVKAMLHDKEV